MFSSNQILQMSGEMSQLETVINFAMRMFGNRDKVTYQTTEDGKYCLGWYATDGWKEFPFDFDSSIVAKIIEQHLKKQEIEDPYEWADGSSEKGFLMKVIPQTFSNEEDGIKNPFYGIVSIEPFINFYAK